MRLKEASKRRRKCSGHERGPGMPRSTRTSAPSGSGVWFQSLELIEGSGFRVEDFGLRIEKFGLRDEG